MRKGIKILFPALIAALSLSGCDFISFGENVLDTYEDAGGYYNGYSLKGNKKQKLIIELQKMCWDKHKVFVPYGQVNNYYDKTSDRNSIDALSDGSPYNQYFYTGYEGKASSTTKEHVWPCAKSGGLWDHKEASGIHYVDNTSYIGGGSDLYHVRPCNGTVNTARGDSYFLDFDDLENARYSGGMNVYDQTETGGKYYLKLAEPDTNHQYADYAEPADEMKGDVARIILYVWIHYAERGNTPEKEITSGKLTYKLTDMTGGLNLTGIMGYSSLTKTYEILKAWNKIDPPSEVEKLRNDTVEKIQGNRNPFVDYPKLVNNLF